MIVLSTGSFIVCAYHVLLSNSLVNVNLCVLLLWLFLFELLSGAKLNPTTVGVALGPVIVGAVTSQLVACVLLLYTAAIVHVWLAVDDNVALFALKLAVNVIASFLYIAYTVLLLFIVILDCPLVAL